MSKLDLTKPYTTRDGNAAGAIKGPDVKLYGWVLSGDEVDHDWWTSEGRWKVSQPEIEHKWDLVNVPDASS